MRTVETCPICGQQQFRHFVTCQDHTVSKETFNIKTCNTCTFKITSPTPDLATIGNYYDSPAYISHATKSTSLLDVVYRFAQRKTLTWKLKLINQYAPTGTPRTLLDYGCGTGQFLQKCQNNGWKINGVEPNNAARENATQLTKTTISASLDLSRPNNYDVITLWHVLEHIVELNQTLEDLKHLLKQSGKLLIAVPNPNSQDARHYKEYWAAYDVPRHLWHFSQHNMAQLLGKHSLKIVNTFPLKLDAYYISLLSEKYQQPSSPFNIFRAINNGLHSNITARKNSEYSSLLYIASK